MTGEIAVDGLTKRYGATLRGGGVLALEDVSLTFDPGTVHVLAGPNGSGKTTLLRSVAGLTPPTAGSVALPDGGVGYAFQRPNLYPDLTVAENLDVFDRLVDARPAWRAHLVDSLRLEAVAHRPAGDLSDGFAKKLDLALALLKEPTVLLLDEPLADVDDATERRFLSLLEGYRSPDRIVVVSSHNVGTIDSLCDRLTVLVDGRVAYDGEVDPPTPQSAYASVLDEHL